MYIKDYGLLHPENQLWEAKSKMQMKTINYLQVLKKKWENIRKDLRMFYQKQERILNNILNKLKMILSNLKMKQP